MNVEWDSTKDRANQGKHGSSLEHAQAVFDDPDRIEFFDDRDYGEERWVAIEAVGRTIMFVIYAMRGGDIRLISARKADRDDEADYYEGKAWR